MTRNKKTTFLIFGFFILLLIGLGVSVFMMKKTELEDETENWRTYSDSKSNFEFKYPPDCEVEDEPLLEGVYLKCKNCLFGVAYYRNIHEMSTNVQPGQRNAFYDLTKDPSLSEIKKFSFQGDDAFEAIFKNVHLPLRAKKIFIQHNDRVFEIHYNITMSGKDYDTRLSEKILSSFKFID